MTREQKKTEICNLANEMLLRSVEEMKINIVRAINSGAIDIDAWDSSSAPMVLPKTILLAVLEDESRQYLGRGTSREKKVRKDANNIKYFL